MKRFFISKKFLLKRSFLDVWVAITEDSVVILNIYRFHIPNSTIGLLVVRTAHFRMNIFSIVINGISNERGSFKSR